MATQLIDGRFSIEHEAATGGMGTIYRARDATTGNAVALKLMRDDEAENVARFAREAAILAAFSHPAIVRYIAHGHTASGQPYLVMDWVEGETLQARLDRTGLSVAETIQIGARVAGALGYAHDCGVVHRDIKPTNLMLPARALDQIAVVDFGVARSSALATSLTATGAMVGTPAYMAPEQARGERVIGPRVDVFSLGCVLYECLTGRMAFEGKHVLALIAKVVLWEPEPPRASNPNVPPALDELIRRMIAKDPAARPDAVDVAAQLACIDVERSGDVPRRPRQHSEPTRKNVVSIPVCIAAIVVASSPVAADGNTVQVSSTEYARTSHALLAALQPLGERFELLSDGSVVSVIADGPAAELAARAVACARAIRKVLPHMLIAIATGEVSDDGDLDSAVCDSLLEDTVGALAKEAMAQLFAGVSTEARPADLIRVDEMTASLIGSAQALLRIKGVSYLRSHG